MEKIITCVTCMKPFRVMRPVPWPAEALNVEVDVECPYCRRQNRITWPKGARFIVVPAK